MSGNLHSRSYHRLFALVEVGTSAAVRRLAAQQIGELAKTNVDEIAKYLSIVSDLLRSERWETRIGAGEVLRAIANNFPPVGHVSERQRQFSSESDTGLGNTFQLSTFDIRSYLASKTHARRPTTYKSSSTNHTPDDEYLNLQKQHAQTTLGIDPRLQRLGLADFANELFSTEDFSATNDAQTELSNATSMEALNTKSVKDSGVLAPCDNIAKENKEWPLDWLWRRSRAALNDHDWRHRHGATIALREISLAALQNCTDAALCAGGGLPATIGPVCDCFSPHKLQQFVIEILILLATDRFCDFVADETVAPIRETAAQALAACLNIPCSEYGPIRDRTLQILLTDMLNISSTGPDVTADKSATKDETACDWQSRYGAMLAVKYIFMVSTSTNGDTTASRTTQKPLSNVSNIPMDLLCSMLYCCFVTLDDASEELAAISAETLAHFADSGILLALCRHLAKKQNSDVEDQAAGGLALTYSNIKCYVRQTIERLPKLLLDSDECSAVRGAYLLLLSKLLEYDSPSNADGGVVSADSSRFIAASRDLIPVLLDSVANGTLVSVRLIALRTVFGVIKKTYDEMSRTEADDTRTAFDVNYLLDFLFIRSLVEPSEQITSIISNEWRVIVNQMCEAVPEQVYKTFVERFSNWFELSMQPVNSLITLSLAASTFSVNGAATRQLFFAGGISGLISDSATNESLDESDNAYSRMVRAEERALRTRKQAAFMLSYLFCKLSPMMLTRTNGNTNDLQNFLHFALLPHLLDNHSAHVGREVACLLIANVGKCMHACHAFDTKRKSDDFAREKEQYTGSFDIVKGCLFFHGLYAGILSHTLIIFSSLSFCIKEMHASAFRLLRAAVALHLRLPVAVAHLTASLTEDENATVIFTFDQVRQLCADVQQQLESGAVAGDDEFHELLTTAHEAYERASVLTKSYNRRFNAELCFAVISLVPSVYLPSSTARENFVQPLSCDDAATAQLRTNFVLPLKPVLLIKPLMEALRNEVVPEHQLLAADALSLLITDFVRERVPGETTRKALRNVLGMSCRRILAGCCRSGHAGGGGELHHGLTQAVKFETNAQKPVEFDNLPKNSDALINAWLYMTFSVDETTKMNSSHGMLSACSLEAAAGDVFGLTENLLDQLTDGGVDGKCADVLKRRRLGTLHVLRQVLDALIDMAEAMPNIAELIFDGPLADAFNLSTATITDIVELTDVINILSMIVKALNLHVMLTKPSLERVSARCGHWFRSLAQALTQNWLRHSSIVVRYYAASLYADCVLAIMVPLTEADADSKSGIAQVWQNIAMSDFIVPLAAQSLCATETNQLNSEFFEYGLTEALYLLVMRAEQRVQMQLASVVSVPLVTRINSCNVGIRSLASHCFSSLVKLLPLLTTTSPAIKNSCFQWLQACDTESSRLVAEQAALFEHLGNAATQHSTTVSNYSDILVPGTKLRSYQEQGVCWLTFLRQLSLGGILCDDMGLGKTLQTLCAVALSVVSGEAAKSLPTLVVCPATLILHWSNECSKFILPSILQPIVITPSYLQDDDFSSSSLDGHHLLIVSYDTARRFCQHSLMHSTNFNYVILDEGHLVRNTRTKTHQTIAALIPRSQRRLILTGTPVQNHAHELWSLFDFLMPGYLGSERQFQARYGKPIALSNAATTRIFGSRGGSTSSSTAAVAGTVSSGRDLEAGTVALHELHQRVLPFILRRLKTHVLQDLPPKLIQDYLCELSDLQRTLYDDFQHSELARKMCVDDDDRRRAKTVADATNPQQRDNYGVALKALHYLRQVCNHPKFVLQPSHPRFESIRRHVLSKRCGDRTTADNDAAFSSLLDNIEFSGKLLALKDLLLSCGIGGIADVNSGSDDELDSSQERHRALIFFQSRAMLEFVERVVFQRELPSVRYLILSGAMPALARASAAEKFNAVDSIFDVMLLTTSAGGLGLNLTGADTVIFVEHDWNPHRDLQAMDRAHRIGQKRVVSVYRLITKNTLEEKIMGMQKFKLFMADTIVNSDNANPLSSMQADEFMNLLALSAADTVDDGSVSMRPPKRPAASSNSRSLSALLESYNPDSDYEEFHSDVFLKKLKPCPDGNT